MKRDKLYKLRKDNHYSQQEVADLIPMSVSAYQRLEAGETRLDEFSMKRLSEIYHCKLEDLLDEAYTVNIQQYNEQANAAHIQHISTTTSGEHLLEMFQQLLKQNEEHFRMMMQQFAESLKN